MAPELELGQYRTELGQRKTVKDNLEMSERSMAICADRRHPIQHEYRSVLNPASLVAALENPVWVFGAPLAAVFALCMLSIQMRDQQEAYRRLVAIPASLAIAAVGAFWMIERVFL